MEPMGGALPLVSIVVPSWQKGRFLRHALESLSGQTYPHLELIVQDNLSTDETVAILEEFEPRLTRVVREKDRGQSDALTRGFQRCRGDILGWLNADDMLMPEAIEQAVAVLQSPSRPDVVYGHTAFLTEGGQFSRYFYEIRPFSADWLRNFGPFIAQPSTFFRRTAYERTGGLDPGLHYAMDWDLWCRMVRAGCTFRLVDEVWSGTRMYPDTKTSGGGLGRVREILRVNRRHGTTRLPLAAAAHFFSDIFPGRESWLSRPLRWAWRRLTGRGKSPLMVIQGLARSNILWESRARICFPLFDEIRGARLRLSLRKPNGMAPRLKADLNGIAGEWNGLGESGFLEARWHTERPARVASIVLEVERLEHGSSVTPLDLLSFSLDKAAPNRPRVSSDGSGCGRHGGS
jgi:glycosyltransferase involved in cell wall biosynthesis